MSHLIGLQDTYQPYQTTNNMCSLSRPNLSSQRTLHNQQLEGSQDTRENGGCTGADKGHVEVEKTEECAENIPLSN